MGGWLYLYILVSFYRYTFVNYDRHQQSYVISCCVPGRRSRGCPTGCRHRPVSWCGSGTHFLQGQGQS